MDSSQQRSFWDRHITSWSDSAYTDSKSVPFVERIARPFRKHLTLRQHLAVEIVVNSGATSVLDLGCGTGDFAVELIGTSKILKNYWGMDIAESAIKEARERITFLQEELHIGGDVLIETGDVAPTVRSVAEDWQANVVVIGRGQHAGGLRGLRAHAYGILRESPCPVAAI